MPPLFVTCGEGFTQPSALKKHMLIHTRDELFTCGTYGKRFTELSNQKKKKLLIYTGDKPFTCGTCGKHSTESSTFKRHSRISTGYKSHKCED